MLAFMLSDIAQFIAQTFSHWVSAWGGIALMVIAMLEAWREQKTPKGLFFGAAIILLFVAMFSAWRDQYASAEWRGHEISRVEGVIDTQKRQINDHKPNLHWRFDEVDAAAGSSSNYPGSALVTVFGYLTNSGETPSIVQHWGLSVRIVGESADRNATPLGTFTKKLTLKGQPGIDSITLDWKKDFLPDIMALEPLPGGGGKPGFVTFVLSDIDDPAKVIRVGNIFHLYMWNVENKMSSDTFTLAEIGKHHRYIPGLSVLPSPGRAQH
jgi:hypothetical protein